MRPTPRSRRSVGARPRFRFRPGLLLRRQPRLWWAVMLSVALATGSVVSTLVAQADRTRLAWGTSELVLVAERDLAAGDELRPEDVALVRRPRSMIPASALAELPERATLRAVVLRGEVVVAERLAPSGLTGIAATLPPGTRAVAIPTEPGMAPPLKVGDRVDVLVALPAESAGDGPPGFAVAAGALVVAVNEAAVTVAVSRDNAPRIAVALGQGVVTLALIGA